MPLRYIASFQHVQVILAGCVVALLNRPQAAECIGVSPSVFDAMVAGGRMPRAVQLSERRYGWIRTELDASLYLLQSSA